jgi:hypothetical protein
MSEERDTKPSIGDDDNNAGPSQDPMTPQKPKSAKMTILVQWQGQRRFLAFAVSLLPSRVKTRQTRRIRFWGSLSPPRITVLRKAINTL